jgi:hypothetical protein
MNRSAAQRSTMVSSTRMHAARTRYHDELMIAEQEHEFENTQRFLLGLHLLASEGRLSRFVYLARKP